MWYDGIDRNTFIKQIYTKVPELLNVRIDAISWKRDGTEVSVVFDMPVYPDNPPEKWNGNNTVSIEISFFVISEFKLEMKDRYMYGNIDIFSHESKIKIVVDGSILCSFVAEAAVIQKISTYIDTEI